MVALASARPEPPVGYNYNQPSSSSYHQGGGQSGGFSHGGSSGGFSSFGGNSGQYKIQVTTIILRFKRFVGGIKSSIQ